MTLKLLTNSYLYISIPHSKRDHENLVSHLFGIIGAMCHVPTFRQLFGYSPKSAFLRRIPRFKLLRAVEIEPTATTANALCADLSVNMSNDPKFKGTPAPGASWVLVPEAESVSE